MSVLKDLSAPLRGVARDLADEVLVPSAPGHRKMIFDRLEGKAGGVRVMKTENETREKSHSGFAHSLDYRSVTWKRKSYTFTSNQAAVVKVLHEAFSKGVPEVGHETLIAAASSCSARLRDVFRKSPAWKTLIVSGAKRGTARLAIK